MKQLIMVLIICAIAFTNSNSFAQIRKIPAEVTEAFKGKFPEAKSVQWQDKLAVFEATFELGSTKYQSSFNKKGEWQSTEKFLAESDLPAAVKDGLSKSKYTEWQKKSYVLVNSKDDGERYRILVEKGALQKKYLYFNKEGQLQKEALTL